MTDEVKPRTRARLPRGFEDRTPSDIAATRVMFDRIREVYELYGFEAVETPLIEFTDALGKFLPDQDRPNEGVFSLKDDDEQWLSLRYDLTAPLARYVAEHYDRLPKPYRSYRSGFVFRNEKPGPGRFRQFLQFDADTVGSASIAADAELCMMAADVLEALGIRRGDYVIKVNNRKILDGVMEAIGLGGDANAARRLTVLRAMDKFDKFGEEGVRLLLGTGRKDESGDFTKGAGLGVAEADQVLAVLQAKGLNNLDTCQRLAAAFTSTARGHEGCEELKTIAGLVEAYGDRIDIDPSIVRGLEYYTGPVFEAQLLAEATDDEGRPIRFGSVGGGGRYDGLVGRFRGEDVPATGFSIGVSRLLAALKALKAPIVAEAKPSGPVMVLVLDRGEIVRYQTFVKSLREAGIAAELYLGAAGMNAQLKYADRRSARCAIIQGSNERDDARGPQIVVRDLVLGAALAKMTKDRADYVELRGKAQQTVPESALVETVREVLARHA
jgi:histidyl-tRNA synthetase